MSTETGGGGGGGGRGGGASSSACVDDDNDNDNDNDDTVVVVIVVVMDEPNQQYPSCGDVTYVTSVFVSSSYSSSNIVLFLDSFSNEFWGNCSDFVDVDVDVDVDNVLLLTS